MVEAKINQVLYIYVLFIYKKKELNLLSNPMSEDEDILKDVIPNFNIKEENIFSILKTHHDTEIWYNIFLYSRKYI